MKIKDNVNLVDFMNKANTFFMDKAAKGIVNSGLSSFWCEEVKENNEFINDYLVKYNSNTDIRHALELIRENERITKSKMAIAAMGGIYEGHLAFHNLLEEIIDFDHEEKEKLKEVVEYGFNLFLDVYNIGQKMFEGIKLSKEEQAIIDKSNLLYAKRKNP